MSSLRVLIFCEANSLTFSLCAGLYRKMTIWRWCRGSPKNILNMTTSTNETKEKHLRGHLSFFWPASRVLEEVWTRGQFNATRDSFIGSSKRADGRQSVGSAWLVGRLQ